MDGGNKQQNIFDHLKNITTQKGKYLGNENWSNFMINRYLSMEPNYCEAVNIIQRNTWTMKGEYLYNLYKDLIPNKYVYLKYIKNQNKEQYDEKQIDIIKNYYEISIKEAKEYITLLTQEEIQNIIEKYGK